MLANRMLHWPNVYSESGKRPVFTGQWMMSPGGGVKVTGPLFILFSINLP